MDGRLPVAHGRNRRKIDGDWRLFREAEEHTLAVDRVLKEKPFRDDRLVRDALGSVMHRGFEPVKVPQPDGLLLLRARGIQILNANIVLAELILESAITEECERVRRTPDLLAGLL